jgi:integrase
LWFRPARRNADGIVTHSGRYFILDSGRQIGVGSTRLDEAEKELAKYIAEKYRTQTATRLRDIEQIPVRDVIAIYARDIAPDHSDPKETSRRLNRLFRFFGNKSLAEINGALCRAYLRQANSQSVAARDLTDLRSAINHHRREGLHDRVVSVITPPQTQPRERWLERSEAAALLWAAWRRPRCKHIAKFILLALYTGRRCSVISSASFKREPGRPWIDLSRGFLRPPEGAKITNKRNPTIPLPAKILTHLRAWHRNGDRYVVGWGDGSVGRVGPSLKKIARDAGLPGTVTPHTLRHTAATWQMQAATDLWEASKFLGMTVKTIEKVYGHHRPDQLTTARDAYARLKRQRPTTNVSPTETANQSRT